MYNVAINATPIWAEGTDRHLPIVTDESRADL